MNFALRVKNTADGAGYLAYAKYPHALVILATAKTNPVTILTGVSFDYTNYDAAPPSVRLVHPITGKPYKYSELPTQLPRLLPASKYTWCSRSGN